MSLIGLMNRPCTVYRVSESTPDAYGDPTLIPDAGTATVCELQESVGIRGLKQEDDLALESSRWIVFFPAGTVIAGTDYFTVDGEQYDLLGDPSPIRSPRSQQISHIEGIARKTG